MKHRENCIFCKIVTGEAPCHKIWENDTHLAFLSIFPNTEGFSVVVTKDHHDSYLFEQPKEVMHGMVTAAREAAALIDKAFPDVGRTGLMFEGFGVNHLHAKLFPMHGTALETWEKRRSEITTYFEQYEGYMSSHDSARADDTTLAKLAERIRSGAG